MSDVKFRATVKHDGAEVGDLPWLEEFWAVRYGDYSALQDRIEELEAAFANISREYDKRGDHIKELEEILSLRTNLHGEAIYLVEALEAERDALKAKLAKAVEFISNLKQYAVAIDDRQLHGKTVATLAELKGELK